MKIELTPDNLPDVIRQIYADSGLTITEAAKRAGIARSAFGRHVRGEDCMASPSLGKYLRSAGYVIVLRRLVTAMPLHYPETAIQIIDNHCSTRGLRGDAYFDATGIYPAAASRARNGKASLRPKTWLNGLHKLGYTFFCVEQKSLSLFR